jgi:hypothetical protein
MSSPFSSSREFKEVIDRLFTMMSEDPEIGPALREADVPQRFEFDDLDLVINVRARKPGEQANLHWEWTDEIDWEPRVKMKMSSVTANRCFQGKENILLAVARRRIKTGGDIKASFELIPIIEPIYERYRAMLAEHHPQLVV